MVMRNDRPCATPVRRFVTLDELEWHSVAKYRARLHQLGKLRSEEREKIKDHTKYRVRSIRVAVAMLLAAGSVFAAFLTTTIIHPNFYYRHHVLGTTARSQECEMASLGRTAISTGALTGLRTDLMSAYDGRSLWDELQSLWKFDVLRFTFDDDGPTILFHESLMSRMPISMMRVLTFGILWPEVIDLHMAPLDNCSRDRLWPHTEHVAAYVVDELHHRQARHGLFRSRNASGTYVFGCEARSTPSARLPTILPSAILSSLGSPWGDFSHLDCAPRSGSHSPVVIGLTVANAAIALAVVLWLVRLSPLRKWLAHYAQRVAPEYSYNLHEVATVVRDESGQIKAEAVAGNDDDDDDDDDIDEDRGEWERRTLRTLSAKLRASLLDEFTPLQMIDFLLPGSTPIRCDKEAIYALGSTLIHALSGLLFHPIIYFGCCDRSHLTARTVPPTTDAHISARWLPAWAACGLPADCPLTAR